MQILPININTNYTAPNFKAKLMAQKVTGSLQHSTSYELEGILHAYNDIMSKLACKTEEGLNHIRKNFPNISIGEGLTFHNCGNEETSILIRSAEDKRYRGLTRILVRAGNSYTASQILKDSFMFFGSNKIVTNFDNRNSKQFPEEVRLATSDELNKQKYDERLVPILKDLDKAMLNFRIFLSKNANLYRKNPDGEFQYSIKSKLSLLDEISKEIEKISEQIPHKKLFNFKKNYPYYAPISGQKGYEFRNIGADKLSILFLDIESARHENLKRIIVHNNDGSHRAGYLIKDNAKLVKNANPKTLVIPDKLQFVDTEEIQNEKLISEFEKYLNMYLLMMNNYKSALAKLIEKPDKKADLVLDIKTQENLSKGIETFKNIIKQLTKNRSDYSYILRENGVKYVSATRGITFNDYQGNKNLHFLPINSKKHSGLVRLSVSDADGSNEKMYLIKDFKYIVKNFNPEFPLTLPKVLVYTDIDSENTDVLNKYTDYLSDKLNKIYDLTAQPVIKKNVHIKPPKNTLKTSDEEYNSLLKNCINEFKYAMKNVDSLGEFQKAMTNINEKVMEYYNKRHS